MKTTILVTFAIVITVGSELYAQQRAGRADQNREQTTRFSQHDDEVTHNWYNQHKQAPPPGFRNQDRLTSDQESRLREGAPLDRDLRRHVHPAPADLSRQLPAPPPRHKYVAIGSHVALIDNGYNVKAVIHLH
jgi:Ni/Co efflux regulator RcnB